jgi:hypothetical protein
VLLDFDPAESQTFFQQSKEGSTLMSQRGFVFVEASEAGSLTIECYLEQEHSVNFLSHPLPFILECREGKARLVFAASDSVDYPVMVDFSDKTMFGIPPSTECVLTVFGGTTFRFTSFEQADGTGEAAMSFEPLSEVLLHLAKQDALEPLPGLNTKGLRIDLSREV